MHFDLHTPQPPLEPAATFNRRQLLASAIGLTVTGAVPQLAFSQSVDFPSRAITLVLPYPAGSGSDQVGRLLAQGLSDEFNVPVVIDNKPGGNGFIATSQVARAAPDGYTILQTGNTTHAANEHLFRKLPYHPVKDFTPLGLVYKGYMVLVVNNASPARTAVDIADMARKSPGKLTFGEGSAMGRMAAEMMCQEAGVQAVRVPYKSNPQGLADLLGGQIDFMFTDGPTAVAQASAGKLRPLAVTSSKRLARLPDVPTMDEAGYKGYELSIWNALYLPAGTPPVIQKRLNDAVRKVLGTQPLSAFASTNVTEITPSTPEELARFQASESAKTGRVLRAAGIQPE